MGESERNAAPIDVVLDGRTVSGVAPTPSFEARLAQAEARAAEAEARTAEAEAELAAARARLETILEHTPVAMFAKDVAGRYTMWNATAVAGSRLPREAVLGRTDRELFGGDIATFFEAQDREVLARGGPRVYEVLLEQPDGLHAHRVVKFRLPTTGAPEVFGITVDETRERSLAGELARSQRLESVGRMVAGVAHDFGNVLMALRGYVSIVEGHRAIPDDVHDDLDCMNAAIDRGSALIRQMLAFGRRQPGQAQVVAVDELTTELEPLLRRLAEPHGSVELEFRDVGALTVRVDPLGIDQVLLNLVANARDALDGAGTITIGGGRLDLDGAEWVELSVRDTGIGMDEATRARVFEPFFTTKEKAGGTGLGLATCRDIVEHAGGRLVVESVPGEGTTVRVLLPRCMTPPHVARAVTPVDVPRGRETVLLVDPDPTVRLVVARMMAVLGYRVTAAADADEALAQAAAARFDAVVLEPALRGMRATELTARLRASAPSIAVLVVGGVGADDDVLELVAGGARTLAKPFDPRALATALRSQIDANRSRAAAPSARAR